MDRALQGYPDRSRRIRAGFGSPIFKGVCVDANKELIALDRIVRVCVSSPVFRIFPVTNRQVLRNTSVNGQK